MRITLCAMWYSPYSTSSSARHFDACFHIYLFYYFSLYARVIFAVIFTDRTWNRGHGGGGCLVSRLFFSSQSDCFHGLEVFRHHSTEIWVLSVFRWRLCLCAQFIQIKNHAKSILNSIFLPRATQVMPTHGIAERVFRCRLFFPLLVVVSFSFFHSTRHFVSGKKCEERERVSDDADCCWLEMRSKRIVQIKRAPQTMKWWNIATIFICYVTGRCFCLRFSFFFSFLARL